MIYTDFVLDKETSDTMGFVNVCGIGVMIAFNVFVIGRWQVLALYRWAKLKKMARKQKVVIRRISRLSVQ